MIVVLFNSEVISNEKTILIDTILQPIKKIIIGESVVGIQIDETKVENISNVVTSLINLELDIFQKLTELSIRNTLNPKILQNSKYVKVEIINNQTPHTFGIIRKFTIKFVEHNTNVNYTELLSKAIRIASVAFENEYDKGGRPYILHCLWVMNKVRHLGDIYMIVAVLHDLLEDTEWTSEMLLEKGFTKEIVKYLEILDHDPNEPYMDYIMNKVALYDVTTQVKLRDLEHNSRITRIKDTRPKDLDRIGKYQKAYMYLTTSKGYK